jgi:hypothetical protein
LEGVYNRSVLVRGTVVQVRFYLTAALLVSGVAGRCALGQDQSTSQSKKEPTALFSPEPENIWNRLYRQLHVRSTYDGREYGFADLDPLLWDETKYLRNGDSNKKALDLLDQFLSTRAELRIRYPIKRAILQRDLFSVFVWGSSSNLAEKLGRVIWRLALSPTEINALPDTYAIAVSRKEFPAAYDAAQPNRAFLPKDLFDINGPWICLSPSDSRLAAPGHDAGPFGGSVFLVFARLLGGRQATLAYLEQLANLHIPPQFPENTEFALVRKLALPTVYGNLMLTPITESVQIRHYSGLHLAADDSEIKLDRAMVFDGNHSGLREVTPEDKEFPVFMTHGFDPFEDNRWAAGLPVASLATCNGCHGHAGYSGIASVMSFSFRSQNPRLAETTLSNEAEKVIRWKQADPNWKSLVQLATGESRVRSNQP